MSANHVSLTSDRHELAGTKDAPSGVLILSNDATRTRALESALSAAVGSNNPIYSRSLKSDIDTMHREQPALILLDAQDPTMDPLHELKRVRNHYPTTPLILLHATTDALVASRALRAGATAFLATRELAGLLAPAIEKALVGERFVSEEVMQGILHGMTENPESETRIPIEILSDREMMVFQLLGKGKCPRNIAEELGVNIKTVATHCNNIRRKLHTPDNRHLTKISLDWTADRAPRMTTTSTYHHR
jgi:DNA-binding NarL/FixJ family response regulator